MSLDCFLNIISGLGMFLYGMRQLSDSLEHFAGNEIYNKLHNATKTPLKGVMLGAGVTGIIQSSTATTLMTVGLVNSGIMNIYEALAVIMGANIGTTVTGQLLRLGDLSKNHPVFRFLKPSGFAPFFLLFGTVQKLFFKRTEYRQSSDIFIGLGILFLGMEIMENGIKPLSQSEEFCNMFLNFKNPFIAIIFGAAVTALLQSSSVSIGILQSLTVTNAITFSAAVPIILGMNIGKVLPEFIATLGTNKNTTRTILTDLMVNVTGVGIVYFIIYTTETFFDIPFWNTTATKSMIANFHTVFNVFTTCALLPFYKKFISISQKIIR